MLAVVWILITAVAILAAVRLVPQLSQLSHGAKTTRDRRSRGDRRQQRVPVLFDRRKGPRREKEVAAAYVAKVEQSRR